MKRTPPLLPPDRSGVQTEARNPRSMDLHRLSVQECVRLINEEDRAVCDAVERASAAITAFIENAVPGFAEGGRLVYVGAGTSGRLGVLDASEAPPTFQVQPGKVVGLIAGGPKALTRSSESLEDDRHGAIAELEALELSSRDALLGVAAGGTTPYVLGAVDYASRLPDAPVTGLLICTPTDTPPGADHLIVLQTGPEVLTGSTRMKAGSATKMTLNIISTTLMVRCGRVYENLMVDVRATSDKLRDRAARIVAELTGLSRGDSFELLERAGGAVKAAVVMDRHGVDRVRAERLLEQASGRLGDVLD